jgi:hypothetical protein
MGIKLPFIGKNANKDAQDEEKAAERMDTFFPAALKSQKDGRNTVSAARALKGEAATRQAMASKPSSGRGGGMDATDEMMSNLTTSRGAAGNFKARSDLRMGEKNARDRGLKRATAYTSDADETRDKLVRRQSDNIAHVRGALRQEKTALVQNNGAGYTNPNLVPHTNAVGSIAKPSMANMTPTPVNRTFDSRPNRTDASALLADKQLL